MRKIPSKRFVLMVGVWLVFGLVVPWSVTADQTPKRSDYLCWSLPEVLDDLKRNHGVPLVWSSHLVHEQMRVTDAEERVPFGSLQQWLSELLAPFQLDVRRSRGGTAWLVVAAPGYSVGTSEGSGDIGDREALLPTWLDRFHLPAERSFPGEWQSLPPGTTHLIVKVATDVDRGDHRQAAYSLKQQIVDAGSQAKDWAMELRVALEGDAATLERWVDDGLAPYVHGYVYRDLPAVPQGDPAARTWFRSPAMDSREVLGTLLASADRGDQLVVFEHLTIDADHEAFLHRLMATPAAGLLVQPSIEGVDAAHARFFIDPELGDFYLALYSDALHSDTSESARRELLVEVPGTDRIQQIHPRRQPVSVERLGDRLGFTTFAGDDYQIYLLESTGPRADHRDVDVASTPLVDPYEEVVKNQVFQRRQREQFESLDVMEYLSSTPQFAGGDRITWEHRILQRKGKYAEYHHLGFRRNGVPYPESKLLKGRLFRTESLIQFQPLEVELDNTYAYRYLGQEEIRGRKTFRIAFQPLPVEGVARKHRVGGEVWLDQKNSAHLRLRTFQEGLDGMVLHIERTYDYEWIHDDGQCFWDWRKRAGSYVGTSLGQQYAVSTETLRRNFDYNRPDIDRVAQEAYDSDVLIHVEVPPEGHRWLVKQDGLRRFEREPDEWDPYPAGGLKTARQAAADPHVHASDSYPEADPKTGTPVYGQPSTGDENESSSSRVLADIHSYSGRFGLWMGGYGSESEDEVSFFPGILFSHSDLFQRGYFGSLSIFEDFTRASFGNPSLFGSSVAFSATVELDYDPSTHRNEFLDAGGTLRTAGVRNLEHSLRLALAKSVHRNWTLNMSYVLRRLDFKKASFADLDAVAPENSNEHVVDFEVVHRRPKLQVSVGLETGARDDEQRWGIEGGELLGDSFQVARIVVESFHPLPKDRMLGAAAAYFKGWDLDRFSRRPDGRSRANVAGFPDGFSFDEGFFASVDLGMSLAGRFPVGFKLAGAQSRLLDGDWESRAGVSFRFLVNGPFKTDLWPSIRTGIYSSTDDDEVGELSYGLVVRRTY